MPTNLRHHVEHLAGVEIQPDHVRRIVERATTLVGAWVLTGVQSAIGILIGLAIMVISLYYFLADGPAMIRAVMHLSPLDSRYERELLERFGQVSRAVVVATLLSAVAQGALAGIGYYFALPKEAPIFLLTALTMVTAMVPFVGAFAIWVWVCGWIYLYGERVVDGVVTHDGNWVTALVLGVYCTVIVSGIDNVIKPVVLHGQSKLHPLLALLSILGGVTVLGPVGILVGPMLVSFLQALLAMLRKELDSFGAAEGESALQLAALVEGGTVAVAEKAVAAVADTTGSANSNAEDGAHDKTPKSPSVAGNPARRRRLEAQAESVIPVRLAAVFSARAEQARPLTGRWRGLPCLGPIVLFGLECGVDTATRLWTLSRCLRWIPQRSCWLWWRRE